MRDVTQNSKSHNKWGVEDQAGRSRFPIPHVYVAPPRLRKCPPSQHLGFPVSFLQPPISKKIEGAMRFMVSILFSRSVKKTRKQKKKKLKMGIYLVALCFDPQWRKLKTNKRTKKHTVSKTHLWGSTCCPGSSGYSQSFFREMSLLCIFLQSVLIASNSHIDDFCQIDTGFLISRQEKLTPGMLKLGWDTGIETKSRQGE